MPMESELIANEKQLGAQIDALTGENLLAAQELVTRLLEEHRTCFSERAQSACLARLLCRFLLHRKMKAHMLDVINENRAVREAFFGQLNTCKYSLVFVLKRVLRHGTRQLADETIALIKANPFRDDTAKSYSDRWGLEFIAGEIARDELVAHEAARITGSGE